MTLPLATLIRGRMAQLGLNLHSLAAQLGYSNLNKGSRRLQALIAGDVSGHPDLLSRLADALALAPEVIAAAVEVTPAGRAQAVPEPFVPHAIILTERSVPSQITFCALTRGEAALRMEFDTSRSRSSYARQALAELNRRTDGGRREIPIFGSARGCVVNYDPHRAVRFNLSGQAQHLLPATTQVGAASWSHR